jgi:hypothetical protein
VSKRNGRRAGTRRERPQRVRDVFVGRPFEGLADETEWVALRELVPSATASLRLADPAHADREVILATVLPMAWPGLVKDDGRIMLGVQAEARSGDLSRDLAAALEQALETEPGSFVETSGLPGPGPRLQDLLADGGALKPTLHETFSFWLDGNAPDDPEVAASLERANASILPTARLASAQSAFWCRVAERAHVRWVLPDDEDVALNALARLHAAGELRLGDGTKYAGSFRAHGLLAPVWDLPRDPEPAVWEDAVAALAKRYAEALGDDSPLTSEQRRSRDGLRGRQLTLR